MEKKYNYKASLKESERFRILLISISLMMSGLLIYLLSVLINFIKSGNTETMIHLIIAILITVVFTFMIYVQLIANERVIKNKKKELKK